MQSQDKIDDSVIIYWGNCPMDILIEVFRKLDLQSLIACMFVNKAWRGVVDYVCQVDNHYNSMPLKHFRLWEQIFEDIISDKGIKFKERSVLNYRDLIINYFLWNNVKDTVVSYRHCFNIKEAMSIKVYKDNLILVGGTEIKYVNLLNWECNKTVQKECLSYEENDSFITSLHQSETMEDFILIISKKQGERIVQENVLGYILNNDSCYSLDTDYIFWVYTYKHKSDDIKRNAFGKYYGHRQRVIGLQVYAGRVYVVFTGGHVFYTEGDGVYKAFDILHFSNFESDVPYLFHECCAAYKVSSTETFQICKQGYRDVVVMGVPNLSALTEHADVLILGYEDGKITIHRIENLLACVQIPEKQFNIQDFVPEQDQYVIKAIDVFEGHGGHHLIVDAGTNIYQFVLKSPLK